MKCCTPIEAFDEIKAIYWQDAPSYGVVKHWDRQFKHGRTSVEIDPLPWRPQSAIAEETTKQVEAAILKDCRLTVHQLRERNTISVSLSF